MKADSSSVNNGASPSPRRLWRRRIVLALPALVLVIAGAFAAADAIRTVGAVRSGRAAFARLAHEGFSAQGRLTLEADRGARHFARAERIARRSMWLGAWSRVPFLGRPARWLRAASATTASLSRRAATAVGRIEPQLMRLGDAAGRLELMRSVEEEFVGLRRAVDGVRLPSSGGFLPPFESASSELEHELARLRETLADGADAARGIRSFLAGPSVYMILAANNSEMRAGGMVLQAGALRAEDGRLLPGRFRSTGELGLDRAVEVPTEMKALYGWLDPGREWRNVGTSPNFPAIGPVYAAMAERIGFRVDGVLQIDVLGVRALLEVIGPVEIDGRRYDASNVERLVLHDLYAEFGAEQGDRRSEFSELAAATLRALDGREWRPERMARALTAIGAGRHLLAWSARPEQQSAWAGLGIDGALEHDGLMLTVQNHTGNKLDWFIRPKVALTVEHPRGEWRRIRARIQIDNPTPLEETRYVAGDGTLVPPGAHRALVAVYLPGWATNVEMPGRSVALVGPDGPMRVIGTRLDIPRGGSIALEVVFSVPPEITGIVVLPSGRAHPVPFSLGGRRFDDRLRRAVEI